MSEAFRQICPFADRAASGSFQRRSSAYRGRIRIACEILKKQPFPGPAWPFVLLGEVTPEKIGLLAREADAIVTEEIRRAGLYEKTWQAFAVLLPVRSVGIMGDERSYGWTVAVRVVESEDAMTADWSRLPDTVLERISTRIVNEVQGINRVVYDISSKPPGTIEWEYRGTACISPERLPGYNQRSRTQAA